MRSSGPETKYKGSNNELLQLL